MEKEDFINRILKSSEGMQKSAPSPFLFEKIAARINSGEGDKSKILSNNWLLAAAASLLLAVNIFCISRSSHDESHFNTIDTDYDLVQQVNYNY